MRRRARRPGATHPKLAAPGDGKANPNSSPMKTAANVSLEGMKIERLNFIF
jgi:hypothetical protein